MSDPKKTVEKTKFNPAEHLIDLRGKQYLEVKFRLIWFKQEYLDNGWALITEQVAGGSSLDSVAFVCRAVDADGKTRATGHARLAAKDWPRYWEKCETAAIGRCLAILGLGTQFAQELDEDAEAGELADAPVAKPVATKHTAAASAPAAGATVKHTCPKCSTGHNGPYPLCLSCWKKENPR